MKNRRFKYTLALGLLMAGTSLYAQDIHFSQFYETSILRNPALTGLINTDYKVCAIYRSQWSSISKPFQTGLVNVEARIPVNEVNDFVSIGLLGYYDRAGSVSLQTLSLYPAINYNKSLEDGHNSYLSVGFTGGYIQRSYDPTRATYDNQFENGHYAPQVSSGETNLNNKYSYFDLGAGISFSSTTGGGEDDNKLNYIIGLSGYHLTQPSNSFFNQNSVKLDMKWNASVSVIQQVNETISYQVHVNYIRQGTYNETILGGLIGYNKKDANGSLQFVISGGAFYRFADAIIPTVRLRYKDYGFTFSYDCNVSSLKAATNLRGGYELSLVKTGFWKGPEHDHARTICPVFFQ